MASVGQEIGLSNETKSPKHLKRQQPGCFKQPGCYGSRNINKMDKMAKYLPAEMWANDFPPVIAFASEQEYPEFSLFKDQQSVRIENAAISRLIGPSRGIGGA